MTIKQQIIDLYLEGKTGYQIAKELNKPTTQVYQVLKIYKLEQLSKQSK
ncbi:MAG: helix-turn-helix domain-containing protein [Ignavibacteria bacterium]